MYGVVSWTPGSQRRLCALCVFAVIRNAVSRLPDPTAPPILKPGMNEIVLEPGAIENIDRYLPTAYAYAVIADNNVAHLHAQLVTRRLTNAHVFTFDAGEQSKTRDTWAALTDQMLERGLGRDTCVIALGGGVTTDLAGFVAATYMRGIPIVQVPTSLLAMIDASVGGKTGVDVRAGKNLVGAFHQPSAVIIDPLVLLTLPEADLINGLAEAVKHGAIRDRGYLTWMTDTAEGIFERRTQNLVSLIGRSIQIKNEFVGGDEREAGQRAALNFGHTIGHALEQVSNYAVPHGHAVALGMLIESEIGTALGVTSADTVKHIYNVLQAVRLPHTIVIDDPGPLVEATRTDKKAREGRPRYVLLERAGRVARTPEREWTWVVPDDVVRAALKQFCV
jgi:3-dehydroquinate synthase